MEEGSVERLKFGRKDGWLEEQKKEEVWEACRKEYWMFRMKDFWKEVILRVCKDRGLEGSLEV